MNPRARKLVFPALAVLISVIVTLTLIEAGLRLAGWERWFEEVERVREGELRELGLRSLRSRALIRHTTREFDVTYESNSMGYYDREWERTKAPGTLRIGFFGDSFTMGHGVGSDRAFPRLAGPLISERTGLIVETLNFGIWGSGTLDEREYIEDSMVLGLDHVVICFYINDIFDNRRYLDEAAGKRVERAAGGGEQVPETEESIDIRLKDFLNENSRLFAFTMERSKNLRDALGLVTYPLEKVFTGGQTALIGETAGHIREIHDYLVERGIGLTVVYIPARVQVCDIKVPDDFDLDLPNTVLAENLGGIDLIDLTEGMRIEDAGALYLREGHFSEEGHRLAARLIAGELAARLSAGGLEID